MTNDTAFLVSPIHTSLQILYFLKNYSNLKRFRFFSSTLKCCKNRKKIKFSLSSSICELIYEFHISKISNYDCHRLKIALMKGKGHSTFAVVTILKAYMRKCGEKKISNNNHQFIHYLLLFMPIEQKRRIEKFHSQKIQIFSHQL